MTQIEAFSGCGWKAGTLRSCGAGVLRLAQAARLHVCGRLQCPRGTVPVVPIRLEERDDLAAKSPPVVQDLTTTLPEAWTLEALAQEIFELPATVVSNILSQISNLSDISGLTLPDWSDDWGGFSGVHELQLMGDSGAMTLAQPDEREIDHLVTRESAQVMSVGSFGQDILDLPSSVASNLMQVLPNVSSTFENLNIQHLLALELVWGAASGAWDVVGWTANAPTSEVDASPLAKTGLPEQATRLQSETNTQFQYVPRLQARASEVMLLSGGRLQLPLLATEGSLNGELLDTNFDYWMDGGPGITKTLPAQSFFIAYDNTDTSITAFGKTYGPQRRPGAPYTMRPFLVVFERTSASWEKDFLANFEVRYWDFEFGYITQPRTDVGIGLCPKFVGHGDGGEMRYTMNWMQTVALEVVLPKSGGPLLLTSFDSCVLAQPVPIFQFHSGWHAQVSQWYLAPIPPQGHKVPVPAKFNVSFSSAMRMLTSYLQT